MVLPLVFTLIVYNVYSMSALTMQAAQNAKNTNYIYEKTIETDISTIESYLVSEMVGSSFSRLNYSLDSLQAYLCGENVLSDFSRILSSKIDGLVAMAFYSENNSLLRIKHASGTGFKETKESQIRTAVFAEMQQEENIERGWYVISAGDDFFLIRILKYGSTYISAVLDFDKLTKPQDKGSSDASYLVYATGEGTLLTKDRELQERKIEIKRHPRGYYLTGTERETYLVVYQELSFAGLVQYYVSPYGNIWDYMDLLQWFLLFCSLLFIALIPVFYRHMQKFFITPLEQMNTTMEEIAAGNLLAHADEGSNVEEFRLMAVTFNHMMDQIQRLKIDAYEKERKIQNATIQYLQIQIRPHFFLNCLKNFYALAEQKKYAGIQELTLELSTYLRRVLTNDAQLITVREEIESVESYFKLSRLSLSVPVSYSISVDKELEDFSIPPLSILTYAENSVKYGAMSNKTLLVNVRVTRIATGDEESYVSITILDNGPGFAPELLEKLNSETYPEERSTHIGIQNVQKRFYLVYDKRATILYSNSNGACVEIFIPDRK